MSNICPKCHCGGMFEDRGKLVCLNCDHTCSKPASRSEVHRHHHVTYTGKNPERPQRVAADPPHATAQSNPYGGVHPDAPKKTRPAGCAVAVLVAAIMLFLPTVLGILGNLSAPTPEYQSPEYTVAVEPAQEYALSELVSPGICYVAADSALSGEAMAVLDDIALSYNLANDVPDLDAVCEYFKTCLAESDVLPDGSLSFQQDGDDICVIFVPD